MPQVRISLRATEDITRIHDFYKAVGQPVYGRAKDTLKAGIKAITKNPEIGRICLEQPDFREWVIPFGRAGFTCLYKIAGNILIIIAVKHQLEADYGDWQ